MVVLLSAEEVHVGNLYPGSYDSLHREKSTGLTWAWISTCEVDRYHNQTLRPTDMMGKKYKSVTVGRHSMRNSRWTTRLIKTIDVQPLTHPPRIFAHGRCGGSPRLNHSVRRVNGYLGWGSPSLTYDTRIIPEVKAPASLRMQRYPANYKR